VQPRNVESAWPSGSEFLDKLRDDDMPSLQLPRPHGEHFEVGETCALTIWFRDRQLSFRIHGRVTELTDVEMSIEFLPQEHERLELIRAAARGESLGYRQRRHPRFSCSIPVKIRTTKGRDRDCHATEISAGGMHVSLEPPFEVDEEVELSFPLPNGDIFAVWGRIAEAIDAGPRFGNGVEFLFSSAAQRDELAATVDDFRRHRGR
jgi:hypothetical protein